VYCASSETVASTLRELAAAVGAGISERGWRLIYGGGGIGLMGEVASSAMAAGGHVTGVIPERLVGREEASPAITELHVVDTMRERKHMMDSAADAFLVLPGGIGTLEELMEILTLRQLGYHDRPIVLLDPQELWQPLIDLFDRMIAANLSTARVHELYVRVTSTAEAFSVIERHIEPVVEPEDWDAALGG
jgi:uncharacterized protein (TIGR00730 family)